VKDVGTAAPTGDTATGRSPEEHTSEQISALSATGALSERPADLRALVPALIAWAVAVWALVWPPGLRLVVGVVLTLLAVVLSRRHPFLALTALVTGLVVLVSAQAAWREGAGPVRELAEHGAVAEVEGSLLVEPIVLGVDSDRPRVLIRLRLHSVQARGRHHRVSTRVLVRADERWRDLQWRQRVGFTATLQPGEPGSAEAAVLRPISPPQFGPRDSRLLRASDHARASLRAAVDHLPTDSRALIPALVVGDTTLTPDDLSDAMRATGMTHLSAVSGSNLAILLTAVMAVVLYTPIRRRARVIVGLLVIVAFIVIARPEPSVLRAAVMGAVGVTAFSRARAAAGLPALAAAIIGLLLFDPWLARSYGFALSTLATLGLILFARPWGRAIWRRWLARARLPPWTGDALAIPVAAHVMTAPVVVLLQGSVSLIAVVANALAAPLVAPATLGGAGTTLIASFFPRLGAWFAWTAALPAWLIARIARWAQTVPGAMIAWPEGAPGALLLAAIFLAVILGGPWLRWFLSRHRMLGAGATTTAVVLLWPMHTLTWPPPRWDIVVCDVGQGDGIVISTGARSAVVVDTGPDHDSLPRCLDRLDVETIDALVLTHFDGDHITGTRAVLARWPVGEVFVSPVADPAPAAAAVVAAAGERGIPVREVRGGDRLRWGRATATVWWPQRTIHAGSVSNNASVVLAVEVGSTPGAEPLRALLLGDIEREAGRAIHMALRRDPLWQEFADRIDVVKTPHHGSGNIDPAFLRAVPGAVAAISVGENDFGHPTRSHLELVTSLGSTVVRTDESGSIALARDGPVLRLHRERGH